MTERQTEALIVGAGLSGAVTALRLARAGIKVTCLEQGTWQQPEDYPGNREDFELAALGPWHANPNVRNGPCDTPITDAQSDIKPMLFHGVGGSTILFSAHWMRFMPSDFRVKALDGVADDWPIDYDELAPFYDEVEWQFGVSGIAGDPAYPERPDYPMPALPIGAWGEKVAFAHSKLGWHWWPGSNAINSRDFEGRRQCVQRSTCRAGCNEGAKGSVDRTHWPEALKLGTQLITKAQVSRITLDARGRASGAIYRDAEGTEHRIRSQVVILAAHAIGTARLLLMSSGKNHPSGLANGSGLVGKRLMMHPLSRTVGLFEDPMMSWQGHWGQSLYSLEFAETDEARGFLRGAKWNLSPSGGPLMAALFPWPGEKRWGRAMHDHVDKWLGRAAIWGVTAEDLPDPNNKVDLDDKNCDRYGDPLPSLHYKVSQNSRDMLSFMNQRVQESFDAAGAYQTLLNPLVTENGWHGLGTCRMGDDPGNSVVDRWNRCHDVPNLLIVDGSTFVTSSCVNPSATIAALALRAADHLIADRRDLRPG